MAVDNSVKEQISQAKEHVKSLKNEVDLLQKQKMNGYSGISSIPSISDFPSLSLK